MWSLIISTIAIILAIWNQSRIGSPGTPIPKPVPYLFLCASVLFILSSWDFRRIKNWHWLSAPKALLALGGAALALLAAYDFPRTGSFLRTLAFGGFSLVLLGWAFAPEYKSQIANHKSQIANCKLQIAASALSAVLVARAALLWWRERQPNLALWLNVLGVALLLLVLWYFERRRTEPAVAGEDRQADNGRHILARLLGLRREHLVERYPHLAEFLLLGLILLGAAFLRGYKVEEAPYGVWFDEAESGLEAIEILRGVPFSPVGRYSTANGSLFFYLTALVFKVFGVNLLVLRLTAVGVGLLSVVVFYFLLDVMFDRRTALVGAALFGVSSWHVNFSRFAMGYNIMALLLGIATLYFLFRGARSARRIDFALAGLMLGLGAYSYAAFRLFPLVIGTYFLLGLWLNWDRLRSQWNGILVFLLIAFLVSLPLLAYAVHHPEQFLHRVNQTSLFTGKPTLDSKIRALDGNVRKHALMFNVVGDPNPRHGIPGTPVLDRITAALFVLGIVYCAYRWRSPAYFVLIIWFVVGMQGGVLSLDWEAPQAHRSLLAVPAVYGLAAIPLGAAWNAWQRQGRGAALLASGIILITLVLAGYLNYDRYFHLQMERSDTYNAFSAGDTAVARYVAKLGVESYRYYLRNKDSRQFQFLVYGANQETSLDYKFFWEMEHLPVREKTDKDIVYLLEPWRVPLPASHFLWYYPEGTYEEIKSPFGETTLLAFMVDKDDVEAILGLKAEYYPADEISGDPALTRRDEIVNFDWMDNNPLQSDSLSVEWTGALYIPESGKHTLGTTSSGASEVWVDGTLVVTNPSTQGDAHTVEAEVSLAKGWHDLRLRCLSCQGGAMRFTWRRRGSQAQVVPQASLSTVPLPPHGLHGRYYRGPDWTGQPAYVQVDPIISFRWHDHQLRTPWSAEWLGTLHVLIPGQYRFRLVTNDYAEMHLDGQTILRGTRHSSGSVQLAEGPHDILVRYRDTKSYAEMRLLWTPPGQPEALIPTGLLSLSPDQPVSVAEAPPTPVVITPPSVSADVEGAEIPARLLMSWGGQGDVEGTFFQAQDMDIAPNGDIYVTDAGNHRVQYFDSEGHFLGVWGQEGRAEGQFLEPFDVAVDPSGVVYVLDSATGWVQRFSPEGGFLGKAEDLGVYNPRGIAVGPDGDLYIADTGSNRILKLNPDGRVAGWFGTAGSGAGEMLQPVDVAVDQSGTVYVVDHHNRRIEVFDSEGGYLGGWALPWSNTFDMPRIAMGASGQVLLTDPPGGRVWMYTTAGELIGQWQGQEAYGGQVARLSGIAIDEEQHVYVIDVENHRIHKFDISP